MDIFNFKGKEWLNIGVSAFLLALLPLVQLAYKINVHTLVQDWTLTMVYFGSFLILGIAYLSKKPIPSLFSVITTSCMMFTSFLMLPIELDQISTLQSWATQLNLVFAVVTLIGIVIVAADFVFDISKLDLKNDYLTAAPFIMITTWGIFKLYVGFTGLPTYQLITTLLIFVWALMGTILTLSHAMKETMFDKLEIGGLHLDNIAFFIAMFSCLMFLIAWTSLGVGLSVI